MRRTVASWDPVSLLYWSFLYFLLAWENVVDIFDIHFDVGFAVFVADIVIALLLVPTLTRLLLARGRVPAFREFIAYEFIIVLLAFYGLRFAGNPWNAVLGQARVFAFYSTPFLVSLCLIRQRRDLTTLRSVGVVAIVSLLLVVGWRTVTGVGYGQRFFSQNVGDVSRYASPYEAGILSTLLFWVLVRLASRRRRVAPWQLGLALFVVVAILLSNYRSVWGAVLVVTVGYVGLRSVRSARAAIRLAALALVGVAALYLVVAGGYMGVVVAKFAPESLTPAIGGRAVMWAAAVDQIRQHPILGSGIAFFTCAFQNCTGLAGFGAQEHIATLHNDFLQALQQFGLVGTAGVVLMLYRIGRGPRIEAGNDATVEDYLEVRTAIRLAAATLCLVSLFEPMLLQPATVALLFAVLGFEVRYETLLTRRPEVGAARMTRHGEATSPHGAGAAGPILSPKPAGP